LLNSYLGINYISCNSRTFDHFMFVVQFVTNEPWFWVFVCGKPLWPNFQPNSIGNFDFWSNSVGNFRSQTAGFGFLSHFTPFVAEKSVRKSVGIFSDRISSATIRSWTFFDRTYPSENQSEIFATDFFGHNFSRKFFWSNVSRSQTSVINCDGSVTKWISTTVFRLIISGHKPQNLVAISNKIGRQVGHKISLLP